MNSSSEGGERDTPDGAIASDSDLLRRYRELGTPDEISAAMAAPEIVYPPKFLDSGDGNPKYIAAKLEEAQAKQRWWLRHKNKGCPNYQAWINSIEREARAMGLDPKRLDDSKSHMDRVLDYLTSIATDPQSSAIFEETEDVVAALEAETKRAVQLGEERLRVEEGMVEETARSERLRRTVAVGKRLCRLLAAVRRLQRWAKHAVPPGTPAEEKLAWEATHVLRFLLYVHRSDIPKAGTRPSEMLLEIAPHHVRMSVEWWMTLERAAFFAQGSARESIAHPNVYRETRGWVRDAYPCEGLILITPPRHMKSLFGTGAITLAINLDHRTQAVMVHAVAGEAAKNMRFVSAAFKGRGHKESSEIGRRNLALFPARLDRRDNDEETMRLLCKPPTRDPTLRGRGVLSGLGGGNINFLWLDDVVEEEASKQPNTRKITWEKITGDWLQRRQGRAIVLDTTTLWHPEDANAKLVEAARNYSQGREGGIAMRVCIMPAGGPVPVTLSDGTTLRAFEPLWKSKRPATADDPWSSAWLRGKYAILGPSRYAIQFGCNPIPDDQKLIKRLKIVPVMVAAGQTAPSDVLAAIEDHREFVKSATMDLSVDPSATKKETAEIRRADKSGLVLVASGIMRRRVGSTFEQHGMCVRVLDASEFYGSPTEVVKAIRDYATGGRRVDRVHIENVGFSVAINEMIENHYRLPSSALIGHKTRNIPKRDRLKAVAMMLEDVMSDEGFPGAKVEIAGVWDNGEVHPLPRLASLVEQLYQHGFTKHDHLPDALAQVLAFLAPIVGVGQGAVTEAIQEAEHEESDRVRALRQELEVYAGMTNGRPRATDPVKADMEFYEIAPAIDASGGWGWNP